VSSAEERATIPRTSPIDRSFLAPIPMDAPSDATRKVEASRRAQQVWAAQPLADRIAALRRAAGALLRDRERIIDLSRAEMGKLGVDAMFTEALGPLDAVNHWAKVVRPYAEPERFRLNPLSFPRKEAHMQLVPRGVVGVIAPWNFPAAGLYRSVIPALLLGNGVVVKPSELTPESSAWFVEHIAAELPPDLVSVVHGDGRIGEALIDAGVDAINFTGSVDTGRRVSVRCAERGIPASVEMGGKDAAIVLADANLARTTAGITHWALQNGGQACGAVEVVFVERSVADALVERLARAFSMLRLDGAGAGADVDVDVPPLANEAQLQRVERHVREAVDAGAQLRAGGERFGPGLGFQPALLDQCTPDMSIVREETFGPVLPIVRVGSAFEAVQRVNELDYGLTASVWTTDLDRGRRLAERLDVGVVTLNNHALTGAMPELAWSGTRNTGTGIANSRWALTTFARPKTLLVDRNPAPEPFWLPFDDALLELGHRLAEAQIEKLGRAYRIPLLIRRRIERVRAFFEM
jgi:acyl-CoA reductase-like NAD-dependent aldehyde dehydrogenase